MVLPQGRKISFLRIRAGMSMRELSRQTGLNIGTISGIENKSNPVTPKTAKRICEALNTDFDTLFVIKDKEMRSTDQVR